MAFSCCFLLPAGLCLHLLHVDRVRLAAAHVKLVVAHAQRQDTLVDADTKSEEDKIGRLLVDWLKNEMKIFSFIGGHSGGCNLWVNSPGL